MLRGVSMRIISRRWVRLFYVRVSLVLICGICPPGVNFMEKTISVRRTTITFSIWDLGGQREFVNMLPLVCNDAVAILFMFDLSRKSTLNSVKEWYRQARGFNKVHFLLI
jgi:GTPase SAR1 family protein